MKVLRHTSGIFIGRRFQTAFRAFKVLSILALVAAGGCGKAARNALDAVDEAPNPAGSKISNFLEQQLALKVPISAIKALRESEQSAAPFELLPFKAVLHGQGTQEGVSHPAKITYQVTQSCAWKFDLSMSWLTERDTNLLRSDVLFSVVERFDHLASNEQTYLEIARVSDIDAETGDLIYQDFSSETFRKTEDGFAVEYVKPEKPSRIAQTSALLTVESERLILRKMDSFGAGKFSYLQADSAVDQLFTQEEFELHEISVGDAAPKFWQVDWSSYDSTQAQSGAVGAGSEIRNQNGVPLYQRLTVSEVQLEVWLTDFEVLEVDKCAQPRKAIVGLTKP